MTLTNALVVRRERVVARLGEDVCSALKSRLLDLVTYIDALQNHLENQKNIQHLPTSQVAQLDELKVDSLPHGAMLEDGSDSDETDEDLEPLDPAQLSPRFRMPTEAAERSSQKRTAATAQLSSDSKSGEAMKKSKGTLKGVSVIRGHRVVRAQLQFLVQHSGCTSNTAETQWAFERPELIDAYLGGLVAVEGSSFTDQGWMYLMEFTNFLGKKFSIPARYAEDWEIFDDLWTAEPLSRQADPVVVAKTANKQKAAVKA